MTKQGKKKKKEYPKMGERRSMTNEQRKRERER
jgi:hypothetical protein